MLGLVTDQQGGATDAAGLRGFWRRRRCPLERMTLGQLLAAFVRHPAVAAYLALAAVSALLVALLRAPGDGPGLVIAAGAALLIYPPAEYLLHRFVLHGRFLYRSPRTVTLWKRIHYDHHHDPDDLRVLFGALPTTLPTVALATLPTGALIAGAAGAAATFGAGALCMLVYEFVHCVQHLPYAPRTRLLRRLKRHHMLHHRHSERGNFGITSSLVDHLAGTYYPRASAVPRSPTAFDLGYTAAERVRYPWLAERSEPGAPGR
ncbi:MAG: fatty acid hydroxylase family protein [Candidatus Rokuibacteriota bacterium]|nr:MAG: fatty acid hydroxylase family protein [Candidatus Rokubacteria bacterium]